MIAIIAALLAATAPAHAHDPPQTETHPEPQPLELRISEAANVTFSGIQAGWLIGGAIVTSPYRADLDFPEYTRFQQAFLANSNPIGPLLMPITLVANAIPLFLLRHEWKRPAFLL